LTAKLAVGRSDVAGGKDTAGAMGPAHGSGLAGRCGTRTATVLASAFAGAGDALSSAFAAGLTGTFPAPATGARIATAHAAMNRSPLARRHAELWRRPASRAPERVLPQGPAYAPACKQSEDDPRYLRFSVLMIKEKDCRGGDEYRALQELAAIFVVQGGFETALPITNCRSQFEPRPLHSKR
jgi:hypothetical protein